MTDFINAPVPLAKSSHDVIRKSLRHHAADVRDSVNHTLDWLGQPFAPVAQLWKDAADARLEQRTPENLKALREANTNRRDTMRDLRRDRRAFEKAREEVAWWNVVNGERRAARIVVRDSRQLAAEAKAVRREARKAYPATLPRLATRCHGAHLISTGFWATVSDSYVSTGAFTLSVAAVAVNAMGVALGMRHVADTATDDALEALHPSQEERELLQRLDPREWAGVAEPRGLADVVAAGATLTDSGIQAKLTLQNQMSLDKLMKMEAQLRAALRLREGTRMELREGKTGGHARLTLRTRSAADHIDMKGWKPGDAWAVNTVTGETVPVPLGRRILFAGTSGSGKSWSARPLMAEASEHDDHRLVIVDRKYIEGRNWKHRARAASELDEIRDLFEELIAEGEARLKRIPRGQDVIEISPSCPRITVFVDEGGEMISDSKTKHPKDEQGRTDYTDIMTAARTVARKYRAAEIILVWCTQKPSLSGEGHGLDSQIAGQIVHRLSLALATATDTQVVFGTDAVERGWKANELPMPGFALFRDQDLGPNSVPQVLRMRAMSPKDVIALPAKPIWSRSVSSTGASAADIRARQQAEATSDPWAVLPPPAPEGDAPTLILSGDLESVDSGPTRIAAADRDGQIMAALRAEPCVSMSDLARRIGIHKQTVKRSLDRLADDGLIEQSDDGCWRPVL